MNGLSKVPKYTGRMCVLILSVVLLVVACRQAETPIPTPTRAVTPTETTRLATPTPTVTWTPSLTPYPPLQWPTATATLPATPTATITVAPMATETPGPEPTATGTSTATATSTTVVSTATPALSTASPTPVPSPTPNVSETWHGEYYANPDLGGQPAIVRQDRDIAFVWREAAPAPGLPADSFSVRWIKRAWFKGALYTFHASMDDGMRVYVDDELLIDEWRDMSERQVEASRHLSAGVHEVRVEYYERGHQALAQLWWEEERTFANWEAHYFGDPNLRGNPVLVRDDPQVSFNWDMGSPDPLVPADLFSVRWTRAMRLAEGLYRFRILVDDGARLWVDGALVIDAWQNGSLREVSAERTLAGAGPHVFQVEYYDDQFDAQIVLGWERVGDPVYPYWKAEYFANQNLAGNAVLVLDERSVSHDWGDDVPAPSLPADHFSVRWTRVKEFEPGRYRFRFKVDDGVRFYIDDKLVLNEWHDAWGQVYQIDVDLPAEPELTIEFYENGGGASIDFSYVKL